MEGVFIKLEEAAAFESIKYNTLIQRIKRNPGQYQTKIQTQDKGGKDQVLVSVSSLSPKAKKAYKAMQKVDGRDLIIEQRADMAPWYAEYDLNHYIEGHKKQYYEAIELAGKVQIFINYEGDDRTAYAERYALGLGVSTPTLYRYVQAVLEANAWALKLEKEDEQNRDYFKALALCRKPKEKATFPSLTPEQKAVIENIWFDRRFAANLGTVEMLYEKFEEIAVERDWEGYPSIKTVSRYVSHLMDSRGAESARYLAANGTREWKNKKMLKGKRDASSLKVMEYVVGDEHTFDFWVQWTAPNGKVKAVRPKLVAWLDMRSRTILGDVACVDANSQTLKESLAKMIHSTPGGVPRILHVDNGKDYTAKTMTGQDRTKRAIEFDSETVGFYQSIGIEEVGRSLPYQPWDKPIERLFSTVCSKFSKWFESYTGTLTGSRTYAKRQKDVNRMLERGELLTMEEFFEAWTRWKNEKYHTREHRGLKDAGEKWITPISLFENGERYEKAAPPREYTAMLLMKADTALVRNQGIQKFGTLYSDYELAHYVGKHVGIKWDIDDVTKLYVYDQKGQKICEAVSVELLAFGPHCSQAALEQHMRNQKRQEREMREILDSMTRPYEARFEEGRTSDAVGKLDLTIRAERKQKVITLPMDKEYRKERLEAPTRKRKSGAGDEYLAKKAQSALARLRAINE
ncbi:transposase [Hungatella effluvii]|uniref:transposase n=1 Tax=Hungatella effluvii TaxID=1096246 RepID=UPI0022E0E452|nr:transposase [Hungatella effluvii]